MEKSKKPANRIPLNVMVECRRSYARRPQKATLKNLSLTGALLHHDSLDLDPEDKVNILFRVSGRQRRIPAVVIWRNGSVAGVQFQPTNNRDVQIVDDFIYFVEGQRQSRKSVLNDIFKHVG